MEQEQILAAIGVNLLALLFIRRRRRRLLDIEAEPRRRRVWIHEMNQSRAESSVFNRFNKLKLYPDRFHSQFRMLPQTFEYLLQVGST